MKINKKKIIIRIIELLIVITTIISTILAIKGAIAIRGYRAYGGEYLMPILGLLAIYGMETIYEQSEKKKGDKKSGRR